MMKPWIGQICKNQECSREFAKETKPLPDGSCRLNLVFHARHDSETPSENTHMYRIVYSLPHMKGGCEESNCAQLVFHCKGNVISAESVYQAQFSLSVIHL